MAPLVLLAALAPAPASHAGALSDWPMYRFDPERTGFNPNETILNVANVANLQVAWTVGPFAVPITTTPAVAGGILYLDVYRHMHAYGAFSGRQVWNRTAGYTAGAGPATSNRHVYVATVSRLVDFDGATGVVHWRAHVGALQYASPALSGGMLYETNYAQPSVFALDASTGKVVWRRYLPSRSEASMTVANGLAYAADDQGNMEAFDAARGSVVWAKSMQGSVLEAFACAGGVLYVPAGQGLVAVDAATGQMLWKHALDFPSSPAVADGVVYIGASDGMHAFDAVTGDPLWISHLVGGTTSPPTVANGVIYVGQQSSVDALDATTGQVLWRGLVNGTVGAEPVVANGFVYAPTGAFANGILYAFAVPG